MFGLLMLPFKVAWEAAEYGDRAWRRHLRRQAPMQRRLPPTWDSTPPFYGTPRPTPEPEAEPWGKWSTASVVAVAAVVLVLLTAALAGPEPKMATPASVGPMPPRPSTAVEPGAGPGDTVLWEPGPDSKPVPCNRPDTVNLPTCVAGERIVNGGGRG